MAIRCTITASGVTNEYGQALAIGTVYTPYNDDYALALISQGKATDTDDVLGERINAPFDEVVYPLDPVGLSADGTSLVSGDGTVISFAGPAYTWVNRPAAASNAGMVIRITDIGPTGFGSMWMSDGTNWRTLTGRQVIASARGGSPTTALSTATAYGQRLDLPAGQLITSGALVLPNGMMRVGVGLEINAFIRHTGTAGTWGAVFRIGTANASGDSALVQAVGSATNDQAMWAFMEANVSSVTGITTGFNMQPQAAASGGSLAERTTNINFAAQMYLGVYINALTPPDTVQLISYSIAFLD